MKKADLIAVGEFMNSLLDPPGLNINGDLKALKAEIHESLKFLEPEDEIPEEIAATIRECNFEFPDEYFEAKEGEDPINKDDVIIVLQKQGIWVNLDDGDGITDVEPVDDSLEKAVEEAETLKDCRELVKANDVFKPLRNGLAGYKLIRKLKEEMLALLVPEEESKKEEEPAKEKEIKKPASSAKKDTKKPAADKKDKGTKKPGVIATIISSIEKSGTKGISRDALLEELVETFPDRDADSMKRTIAVQVPGRISRERFELEKTKDGAFRKKK